MSYTEYITDQATAVTYRKTKALHQLLCDRFSVRDKRQIFALMRQEIEANGRVTAHTFFPRYGLTAGEFSTYCVICEKQK